ncbi:MAG: hypothetical protein AAF513_04505 [Pseudomonadota bacterium]
MKILKYAVGVLVLLGVVLVFITPLGPLPGFFIGGRDTPIPAQWPDTSDVHEIRLGVSATLPRVVIIWVVEYEQDLYVVGSAGSGWVEALGEGGPAQLRIGDNTYAVNARRETEKFTVVRDAWLDKYRPDYPDIVAGFPTGTDAQRIARVFLLDRS